MYIPYDNISPKSKSWIYILSKNIDKNILLDLNTFLIKICEDWKSHGQITKASYVISNNRFIILFAEDKNLISGCSIDKSNKELRKKLGENARATILHLFSWERTIEKIKKVLESY